MRTSLYSILCIGIRLTAILLAVNALLTLPSAYASFAHGEWSRGEWGWMFALWLLILLVAVLLWIYPGVLARLAAGKASREVFDSSISPEQLQYIAFSVVGLWIAASGLISFAQMAIRELFVELVLHNSSNSVDGDALRTRAIAAFIEELVRISVGVVLLLQARGLIGLLRRLRQSGLPPVNDAEAASDTPPANKEDT